MKKEQESIRYNLKMSVDLHAILSSIAKTNKRSLQAEIINRLEKSIFGLQSSLSDEECIEILENKEIGEILDKPEEIGQKEFDKIVKHSVKLETKLREYTEKVNATFKEWQEYLDKE